MVSVDWLIDEQRNFPILIDPDLANNAGYATGGGSSGGWVYSSNYSPWASSSSILSIGQSQPLEVMQQDQ